MTPLNMGPAGVANFIRPRVAKSKRPQMAKTNRPLTGGECGEDMGHLREDAGLEAILGYRPPAPETARQLLDRFHDESWMAAAPVQGSFIPPNPEPWQGGLTDPWP